MRTLAEKRAVLFLEFFVYIKLYFSRSRIVFHHIRARGFFHAVYVDFNRVLIGCARHIEFEHGLARKVYIKQFARGKAEIAVLRYGYPHGVSAHRGCCNVVAVGVTVVPLFGCLAPSRLHFAYVGVFERGRFNHVHHAHAYFRLFHHSARKRKSGGHSAHAVAQFFGVYRNGCARRGLAAVQHYSAEIESYFVNSRAVGQFDFQIGFHSTRNAVARRNSLAAVGSERKVYRAAVLSYKLAVARINRPVFNHLFARGYFRQYHRLPRAKRNFYLRSVSLRRNVVFFEGVVKPAARRRKRYAYRLALLVGVVIHVKRNTARSEHVERVQVGAQYHWHVGCENSRAEQARMSRSV